MKKILFILLLFSGLLNAQSSFKDAEHEFVPACNNGKSIVMARFWFHINAIDTVWKVYYFDSTGKNYTPSGAVTLGFCFKADTGALSMFKKIIDSLSSINNKMATNNLQNDTIINKLDSSNYYLKDIASKSVVDTSMKATISLFQVKDCAGANVGAPEVVQKTIVLNKINASICNADDFKDTSANAILRAIKTNLADSLRTYNYSYQIQNNKQNDSLIKRMDSLLANSGGDTSINPTLRLLQKNVYDSLRTFNYSYLDTTNARLLQMVGKTYFDSSWYVHLRGIQKNIADSLRTYNYKYDSINIVRNDSMLALMKGDTANLDDYGSSFQVQDCAGANVGAPQNVLKTVVLNKVIASICNTADFKGDTSINSVLRAMQKNLADSLRIFRFQYSYFDSLQATADALLAKTTFDSSWYSVLRDIRTNVKDSLRTFKYSYIDTTNARLAQLLLKQFADTSINPTLRQLQKNVADSLRTFNYSYSIANNIQNDTIIAKLSAIANKTSVDSTLIKASSLYQVLNCNDSAVGSPQTVLKTIVMNKMQSTICNVSEIASAIKTDTSNLALLRTNNKQNDTIVKRLDSLLASQTATILAKPLAKNISGTTYNTLTNCEHLALGCCWTGTVTITDAYSNTITLTNGEGFNFEAYKGRMSGITINATSATGAIITGVCQ
jgi:hypothetical protein